MDILRNIIHDNIYQGTYKLTLINNQYWWKYFNYDGDAVGLSIGKRKIIKAWDIQELIEFKEEDLSGD